MAALPPHVNYSAVKSGVTPPHVTRNLKDGTKYSRTRPTSFLTHHMRQISSAAVITDACNIEKEIIGLKISQAPRGA